MASYGDCTAVKVGWNQQGFKLNQASSEILTSGEEFILIAYIKKPGLKLGLFLKKCYSFQWEVILFYCENDGIV